MKRDVCLSIIALADAVFGSGQTWAETYAERVRHDYDQIAVVTVQSALPLMSSDGRVCSYRYEGQVRDVWRGKLPASALTFVSKEGIAVGHDFLIYLSSVDSRHAHATDELVVDGLRSPSTRCPDQGRVWYVSYDEIHPMREVLVKDFQNGSHVVEGVEFDDVSDFLNDKVIQDVQSVVDVNYLKGSLSDKAR